MRISKHLFVLIKNWATATCSIFDITDQGKEDGKTMNGLS
jgi:hypothetical protein